jgi:hypothetical protein
MGAAGDPTMPRYHLNVFNNIDALDPTGIELPNIAAAKAEAVAGARDIMAAHVKAGQPIYSSHRIEITDEAGNVLHEVKFGDIIDLRQ